MRTGEILRAWGRILSGRKPSLSIEITRRCPLSCPGCYAYANDHLGDSVSLSSLRDYEGQALIAGVLELVDRHRPLHLSIVGGEPLVRWKEVTALLPQLADRGIHTQVVTSAVRPIPGEWREARKLNIVVSIDGLQPEHDARRAPATYERILRHIQGHPITVHCTITRQMTERPGYLRDFLAFWSARQEVRKIWMSLFTPQQAQSSAEVLSPPARERVIDELSVLTRVFPLLGLPAGLLEAYRRPPAGPEKCIFARTTGTVSADLRTPVSPCQLGGTPDCSQCGCVASAALEAVGRHRLPFGIRVGAIYEGSLRIGRCVTRVRALGRESEQPLQLPNAPPGRNALASGG